LKKTTDNRYCYHISCRNSVGKNAKKNGTQVSGRKRASVTCKAASRSFTDAHVTRGSHVTLARLLVLRSSPRISELKRDFSPSKLSPVSLSLPFAFPVSIVTCFFFFIY